MIEIVLEKKKKKKKRKGKNEMRHFASKKFLKT